MTSPVVSGWLANAVLLHRGAAGCLALTPNPYLNRGDVVNNSEILIHVIRYLGLRPSIDVLTDLVEEFFRQARPRGKSAIKRP